MSRLECIVIGGSAGALEALYALVPALPDDLPVPVALVVHVMAGRPSHIAEILGDRTALRVKEAEDKEPLAAGTLYVAPPDYHLFVERRRCVSLSVDEVMHFSRPAIDPLFESAAGAYGPALVGVLLSGANEDGARGLQRIVARGGRALVQAPSTAQVPTMPEAGARLAPACLRLTPAELGVHLAGLARTATLEGR
jgi:two-component system chemotaxis response regulator CheB